MTILLFVLMVVSAIFVISIVYSRQREKRLRGYSGLPREEFVKHFAAQGVPRSVSETVYDSFKQRVRSEEFKPSPEMSIEDVFEQVSEDTEDDARHILEVLGIPAPPELILEDWEGRKVRTVADLALWIDWVRRQHNSPLDRP